MVNYNKGIIYKLCCKDPKITDIYIGSTTDFTKRKWNHKTCCTNKDDKSYNYNVYKFIREHGNWDNWDIIQVEAYNAENKRDLESRERHWIEDLKSTLNRKIPTQTSLEYYQNNREKFAIKSAIYQKNNREKISKKAAEYRENNKALITVKKANRYQKNKEQRCKKALEYYENNKEQIAEKYKIKVVCVCGSEVTKAGISQHKKTKKHLKFLEPPLELPISIVHSA